MLVLPHSHLASCLPYLMAALPRVAPSPPACHSSWPPHLSLASLHGHLTSHTCSPHTCHPSLPSHLLAHPPLGLSYHKPTTPAPASQTLMFLRVNHRPPRLPFSPWPCGTATKGLVSRRVQQSPTEPTELLPAAAESMSGRVISVFCFNSCPRNNSFPHPLNNSQAKITHTMESKKVSLFPDCTNKAVCNSEMATAKMRTFHFCHACPFPSCLTFSL